MFKLPEEIMVITLRSRQHSRNWEIFTLIITFVEWICLSRVGLLVFGIATVAGGGTEVGLDTDATGATIGFGLK